MVFDGNDMKRLLIVILSIIFGLLVLTGVVLHANNMLSAEGLRFATQYVRENSLKTVFFESVQSMLPHTPTNAAFDRRVIEGRGQSPWVIRSNLDGKPRILNLALAPGWWASYDLQSGQLYQLWKGELNLEGAAYNYQHGPQPFSSGEWLIRQAAAQPWIVEIDGIPERANFQYQGYRLSDDGERISINFELTLKDTRISLRLTPELYDADNERAAFQQTLLVTSDTPSLKLFMGEQVLHMGPNTLRATLGELERTPIQSDEKIASANTIEDGERIVSQSDCLSCHSIDQELTGPSFARIAQRFRGNATDNVISALAESIVEGAEQRWGPSVMPPHPQLSIADAKSAAKYVMSHSGIDITESPPLKADGSAYAASRGFDVEPRLETLHPSFQLMQIVPDGFEPKVGGIDFDAGGRMVVSSWDIDGSVFAIQPRWPRDRRVMRIADGLQEPLGVKVVDDRLFVLQKQEITELIDHSGDGIIDEYKVFANGWAANPNFHSFAFGLEEHNEELYALLSICVEPGGASCSRQETTQGKLLAFSLKDGSHRVVASGFRTPNGIGKSPNGQLLVTDNQGDWLPASKLVHVKENGFYGSRAVNDPGVMDKIEQPPIVWIPQDEIGNSPTQPASLNEGPYAGQIIFGDVYQGGIQRVSLQEVNGQMQGAVYRFSAGFQSGVNRIVRGPDNALYLGEIGNPPNWGELGKVWHGLERLSYNKKTTFELLAAEATANGFSLRFTDAINSNTNLTPDLFRIEQWFYHPTERYGGPKYDLQSLEVSEVRISDNRKTIDLSIKGLKPGYVVYIHIDKDLRSVTGDSMWVNEAWYTLNHIPGKEALNHSSSTPNNSGQTKTSENIHNVLTDEEKQAGWKLLFDGHTFGGWRNYGQTGAVRKWRIDNGSLRLDGSGGTTLKLIWDYITGSPSADLIYADAKLGNFEFSAEWKISAGGNSGIMYLVSDESHSFPWETGLEMQVLDNDGHADGKIKTHRAGDLYDIAAATPETVKAVGEWNKVKIRLMNGQLEHWLNGEKVVDISYGDASWEDRVARSKFADMPDFGTAKEGFIVLQDHGDTVQYRNLKVRTLSTEAAP